MNPRKGLSAATASLALGLALISMSGPAAHAQSPYDPYEEGIPGQTVMPPGARTIDARAIQRSVNLARGEAVKLNGGLSQYRPARCMFQGSENNPCIIQADADGIVFRIPGGAPGWEESNQSATVITEVRIAADGRSVLGAQNTSQAQPEQPGGQPEGPGGEQPGQPDGGGNPEQPGGYPEQPDSYPQQPGGQPGADFDDE